MTGAKNVSAPEGPHENSPAPPALGKHGEGNLVPEGRLIVLRTLFNAAGRTLTLLLATILTLTAPLAAKSWRVSNFQDTITVNPDGSALVNETIALTFKGEFN